MERLKQSLEAFDDVVFKLEDSQVAQREALKKHADLLKESRSREANVLATAQKLATRLDQAIEHVERVLRG